MVADREGACASPVGDGGGSRRLPSMALAAILLEDDAAEGESRRTSSCAMAPAGSWFVNLPTLGWAISFEELLRAQAAHQS